MENKNSQIIVYEWAERISPIPVTFKDHNGNIQSYRIFSWMGKQGITDAKGEAIILPAIYPNVSIEPKYEVAIVGDSETGWKILPLADCFIAKTISQLDSNLFGTLFEVFNWLSTGEKEESQK